MGNAVTLPSTFRGARIATAELQRAERRRGTVRCSGVRKALLEVLSARRAAGVAATAERRPGDLASSPNDAAKACSGARSAMLAYLTASDLACLYFVCRSVRDATGWRRPAADSEAWVSCAQAAKARVGLGLERADDRVAGTVTLAARHGRLDALEALCAHGARAGGGGGLRRFQDVPLDACTEAARGGHTRCLAYLRQSCRAPRRPVEVACLAALSGEAPCLAFALDDATELLRATRDRYGELFGRMVCANAAASGSIACLRVARGRGCGWDSTTCAMAARRGAIDVLRYAREGGCPWDGTAASFAAASGKLRCLEYAASGGCPVDVDACAAAARGAQPEALRWLLNHLRGPGGSETSPPSTAPTPPPPHSERGPAAARPLRAPPPTSCRVAPTPGASGCKDPLDGRSLARVVEVAAEGGCCECLSALHEIGAPATALACRKAARAGSLECLRYLRETMRAPWDSGVCAASARAGSLACLSYAHASGCRWGARTCASAAAAGSVACLAYARERGCAWDAEVTASAARADSLACLKYACEHGCPWHPRVYHDAARAGSLRCLAFAAARGCPFPSAQEELEEICPAAALSGDAAVLRAVREHALSAGVVLPFGATTCEAAARARSLPCLRYAHESGCEWDERTTEAAAAEGAELCLRYARRHGCAWDARVWYKAATRRHFGALAYALQHGCDSGSVWSRWRRQRDQRREGGRQQPQLQQQCLEVFAELNIMYSPHQT